MNKLLTISFGLAMLFVASFANTALADASGHWSGAITLPTGELAIHVSLENADEAWSGTIDIPAQGLRGSALSNVRVEDEQVHFEMDGVPGQPTFDGSLDGADVITGDFTQGGQKLAFQLERSENAPAKPTEIAGFPGEGMAGEWLGALKQGPIQLRLALSVTSEDDKLASVLNSIDQGAKIRVKKTTFADQQLTLSIPEVQGSYEGTMTADGSALEGTWAQMGQTIPLTFQRQEKAFALNRPQEPEGPFPYTATDMTFANEQADISLAGTLIIPEGDGPFPAVVFVSGSGAQDRDEQLMGHKPFWVIADHLARQGIASLRYDDRGFGESEGDHMNSTVQDFATDAAAAVVYLAQQPKVDSNAIGILGHSEGGVTGPLAALQGDTVNYLVLLAPPAVPLIDLLQRQSRDVLLQEGADMALVDRAMADSRRDMELIMDESLDGPALKQALETRLETIDENYSDAELAALGINDAAIQRSLKMSITPWFRSILPVQPASFLSKLEIPVFALFGGKDIQVAADQNEPAMRAALEAGSNRQSTVKTYPALNHLFQTANSGSAGEYGQIDETISPTVLNEIAEWILART